MPLNDSHFFVITHHGIPQLRLADADYDTVASHLRDFETRPFGIVKVEKYLPEREVEAAVAVYKEPLEALSKELMDYPHVACPECGNHKTFTSVQLPPDGEEGLCCDACGDTHATDAAKALTALGAKLREARESLAALEADCDQIDAERMAQIKDLEAKVLQSKPHTEDRGKLEFGAVQADGASYALASDGAVYEIIQTSSTTFLWGIVHSQIRRRTYRIAGSYAAAEEACKADNCQRLGLS
jgi:hypothetical protein